MPRRRCCMALSSICARLVCPICRAEATPSQRGVRAARCWVMPFRVRRPAMIDSAAAAAYCGPAASPRLKTLAALARAGGATARGKLRRYPLDDMVLKGARDYQTEADRAVEAQIV